MLTGIGTFKCKDCNRKFVSPLAEYMATSLRTPASPCPNCGSWNMKPIGWSRLNFNLVIPDKKK